MYATVYYILLYILHFYIHIMEHFCCVLYEIGYQHVILPILYIRISWINSEQHFFYCLFPYLVLKCLQEFIFNSHWFKKLFTLRLLTPSGWVLYKSYFYTDYMLVFLMSKWAGVIIFNRIIFGQVLPNKKDFPWFTW